MQGLCTRVADRQRIAWHVPGASQAHPLCEGVVLWHKGLGRRWRLHSWRWQVGWGWPAGRWRSCSHHLDRVWLGCCCSWRCPWVQLSPLMMCMRCICRQGQSAWVRAVHVPLGGIRRTLSLHASRRKQHPWPTLVLVDEGRSERVIVQRLNARPRVLEWVHYGGIEPPPEWGTQLVDAIQSSQRQDCDGHAVINIKPTMGLLSGGSACCKQHLTTRSAGWISSCTHRAIILSVGFRGSMAA